MNQKIILAILGFDHIYGFRTGLNFVSSDEGEERMKVYVSSEQHSFVLTVIVSFIPVEGRKASCIL